MTYKLVLKLIEVKRRKGEDTPEWKAEMRDKLDIFLLNNRLTEEQYNELNTMLNEENVIQ